MFRTDPCYGLYLLAILIPVAWPYEVIGDSHLLQLPVQAVTKGAGLVAGEYFIGQRDLLGHPQHELRRFEPLWRLWRAAINDAHRHVAI